MHERSLILIPCCGDKRRGGSTEYDDAKCIINNLSLEAGAKLMKLRREAAGALQEEPGRDLGFEDVNPAGIKYQKAHERYSGNLYSRISENSWVKLGLCQELKLIIVSALYGVVNYNELIRYYNRNMKEDRVSGKSLKTWWCDQGLFSIIIDYVTRNRIEVVHDFLSTDYGLAVWPLSLRLKEIKAQHVPHTYSGLGSGSNYYRGDDVNTLIQAF